MKLQYHVPVYMILEGMSLATRRKTLEKKYKFLQFLALFFLSKIELLAIYTMLANLDYFPHYFLHFPIYFIESMRATLFFNSQTCLYKIT